MPLADDIYRLAPELVLCAFGILVMFVDPFVSPARKRHLGAVALLGAGLALAATKLAAAFPGAAYSGLLQIDGFSIFVHLVVGGASLLVILGSASYLEREQLPPGEFYALVLFATAGMGIMASANELLTGFVGLEMSSIASYVLAGYRRNSPRSNESAMKYFLLGSFATAFFLYGVAMAYGATGTTNLQTMQRAMAAPHSDALLTLGLALMLVGLAFKVATAPFQVWTPDVYEGAPAPVTALFSAGPKAAAFALLMRILFVGFADAGSTWFWAVWFCATLTMFVGNLAAVVQTNVKRMLAYSSIAHAGYILVGITAVSALADDAARAAGIAAVLFYLAAYALMKLGAFTLLAQLSGPGERRLELADYSGLGREQPVAAACMSVFLLSLLGLPVTAGFLGKFYVFRAAVNGRLLWLVVLMAVNSVIAAYYYLRVIVAMYMREPQGEWTPAPMPGGVALVLLLTVAGTLYLGLFPGAVLRLAAQSALSLP